MKNTQINAPTMPPIKMNENKFNIFFLRNKRNNGAPIIVSPKIDINSTKKNTLGRPLYEGKNPEYIFTIAEKYRK